MDVATSVSATGRSRKRAVSRQRAGDLVAVYLRLPRELIEAAKTRAASRGVSMAAVIAEAARKGLEGGAPNGGDESRDALLARHLSRIQMKLRTVTSQERLVLETLGVLGQLLLGSLPMPATPQEQKRYDEQVARRYPKFIEAVAKSVARPDGQFLRALPLDAVAAREDFPDPPNEAATDVSTASS